MAISESHFHVAPKSSAPSSGPAFDISIGSDPLIIAALAVGALAALGAFFWIAKKNANSPASGDDWSPDFGD